MSRVIKRLRSQSNVEPYAYTGTTIAARIARTNGASCVSLTAVLPNKQISPEERAANEDELMKRQLQFNKEDTIASARLVKFEAAGCVHFREEGKDHSRLKMAAKDLAWAIKEKFMIGRK